MKLPQNSIFIIGYPRSGTTLLQRLLVTQPGIFSFPETHYFCVIEKILKRDETGNILPECFDNVFKKINEKMEFQFTREEITTLTVLSERKLLSSKRFFEYIISRFLLNLHPAVERINSYRWIEKTPNHALFIDRIMEFYPEARILHILRHPVPSVFSRKIKFPFNHETPIDELARRWDSMLESVERFKEMYPGNIYTLRYEDLVEDMEKELAVVADFIGITFDFSLLSYFKNKEKNGTMILPSESWKLDDIQRDVSNTNLAYKERISPEDAQIIEEITIKGMNKYGYRPYHIH